MLRRIVVSVLSIAVSAFMSGTAHAAAGELDCSFGNGGIANLNLGSVEPAYDAAYTSDGRIVTVGSGSGVLRLTRLTTGGALDASFGTGGTVLHNFAGLSFAGSIARDSQDRIVVAGRIANPDPDVFVARFTASGAIDATFGGGDGWTSFDFGVGTAGFGEEIVGGVVVDASDRIIVGGSSDSNGNIFHPSNANLGFARLTTAGDLDPAFGGGDGLVLASSPGTSNDDDLRGLALDANGRIIATGSTSSPNASNQGSRNTIVARLLGDGTLDASFDGDGVAVVDMSQTGGDDFGVDIVPYDATRFVVLASGSDDPLLGRFNDNGSFDTTFAGDGVVQRSFLGGQDVTEHVRVQADGKLLVTGWPVVGNNFHFASMRFDAAGALDTSWGAGGVATTAVAFNERSYVALLGADQRLVMAGGVDNDQNFIAVRYRSDDTVAIATTTSIVSRTPSPSLVGELVTVGYTVTASGGGSANGSVTVSDGVNSCTGTVAAGSCALGINTGGLRSLTATYQGNACYSGSTSPAQTQTVEHRVTPQFGTGGTLSPSVPQRVLPGAVVVFDVLPQPGFRIDAVSGCAGTLGGDNRYTTAPVQVHCTVTATFAALAYPLSYTPGAHGSLSGNASQSVPHGGTGTQVTAIPDTGYRFVQWSDGSTANPRTDSNVTSPIAVTAEFELLQYAVTPLSGAGGSLTPGVAQMVGHGLSTQFVATPDPGHRLVSVSGCDGTLAGSTYTTGAITGACSVSATFNRNPFAFAGVLDVTEDSAATGTLTGNDDDALAFEIVQQPAHGTVTITDAALGTYTYTPSPDANGSDTFTFRVDDGVVQSVAAPINVTIAAVNDAPTLQFAASPTHVAGTGGTQSVANFATLDAGPPDEDLAQVALAYPVDLVDDTAGVLTPGSVAIAANGTLSYTLTGIGGVATITARGRDNGGTALGGIDSSSARTFTISVAPGADLDVMIDNERDALLDDDGVVYRFGVRNMGPNAVAGATVSTSLSALSGVTWSCLAEESTAPCPTPASGTGAPSLMVDLPVGEPLFFEIVATVDGNAGAFVTASVTATPPANTAELQPLDNTASDSDPIVPVGVFADGFEAANRAAFD